MRYEGKQLNLKLCTPEDPSILETAGGAALYNAKAGNGSNSNTTCIFTGELRRPHGSAFACNLGPSMFAKEA